MATIKSLIERVETRLFLVSGVDVQIHAEGQIEEMIRSTYNTLFDDFWDQNYTYFITTTLDGTTGEVVEDLSTLITRYQDINTAYWDTDETPLPRVSPGASLSRIRTRAIMPSANPTKVFKMVPATETGSVHLWYRTRLTDDIWETQNYDTQIMMDDEMLLHGVVSEFLVNDGSNMEAAKYYLGKFESRKKQMEDAQWVPPLNKRKLERDGPLTRWE